MPARMFAAAAGLLALLAAAGCTTVEGGAPAPATSRSTTTTAGASSAPSDQREKQMRITVTIGEDQVHATLDDSAASRDLAAQLPVTLQMIDHGAVEKTGPLPSPLSLVGQPTGADPDVGDVGYYAPGHDFVLYYGDQGYYPGIVVLGRMDVGAAERIAAMRGTITARIALDAP